MGVNHGAFVNVSANVHEHGRHAHDARSEIGPHPDGRAAGHYAHAVCQVEAMEREGVFVNKTEDFGVAHLSEFAQPKSEKNALFHPDIHAPSALGIRFRGAYLAFGQRGTEVTKHMVGFREALDGRTLAEERLNGLLEWMHGAR